MTIILPKQCLLNLCPKIFWWFIFLLNFSHCAQRRCALHSLKQTDFSVENCAKLAFIKEGGISERNFLFKGKKSTQKTFNRRPVQICWTIGRHTSYICLLLQTNFFLCSEWCRLWQYGLWSFQTGGTKM